MRDGNGEFSSLLGRCDHTRFAFDRLVLMVPQGLPPSRVVVTWIHAPGYMHSPDCRLTRIRLTITMACIAAQN
jgi:hypothetical protein